MFSCCFLSAGCRLPPAAVCLADAHPLYCTNIPPGCYRVLTRRPPGRRDRSRPGGFGQKATCWRLPLPRGMAPVAAPPLVLLRPPTATVTMAAAATPPVSYESTVSLYGETNTSIVHASHACASRIHCVSNIKQPRPCINFDTVSIPLHTWSSSMQRQQTAVVERRWAMSGCYGTVLPACQWS